MRRIIMAFNGDLESRLALHWLVNDQGYEVITLSINLGQEIYLEPLGELALELGARAAQVIDRREAFLREFALPVLQADAVYQSACFLGSALARYLIAQELVRLAKEESCDIVAHSAASKGNDQVRMETAIAAQNPGLKVLAAVRAWNLRGTQDKLKYARRFEIAMEEPKNERCKIDRNLWGVSSSLTELNDPWVEPPREAFVLTRPLEDTPAEPAILTIGFEAGVPVSLDGQALDLQPLVRQLNTLGGLHGIGRHDVVEDRLFGIKSREFYEVPTPTILHAAHRDLQNLVQSREMIQLREQLARRYAELVYSGLWFHEVRAALQGFFQETQKRVTGEVRVKLFRGNCVVLGRRSPFSLYDGTLANQTNLEFFDNQWAQGFTHLFALPSRLAAQRQGESAGN